MPNELTWKKAIEKVLASSSEPLHYGDITDKIISEGYRKNLGATPSATVSGQITSSIKKQGVTSPFLRMGRGVYTLKARSSTSTTDQKKLTPTVTVVDEEEQYAIVSSLGMFWRRENVDWSRTPKLFGVQKAGATPVDFCNQLGIYLLYDGREVIYVGRTTDRYLGTRLYEHTYDRFSARWDRFSWFGLKPVNQDGSLGNLPPKYEAAKLIPALEAILIEALEPRQNRKRGDDLATVEYLQKVDPSIEKAKALATINDIVKSVH